MVGRVARLGDLSCCVLSWMALSGEFFEDFDVAERGEGNSSGSEWCFPRSKLLQRRNFA